MAGPIHVHLDKGMRIDDIRVEGSGFNVVRHRVVRRHTDPRLTTDAPRPAPPPALDPFRSYLSPEARAFGERWAAQQTPLAPEDVTRLTTDAMKKFSPSALDAGANSTQAIRALEARHQAFWATNETGGVIEEAAPVVQITDAAPKRKPIKSISDFAQRCKEVWSGGGDAA
jgi:hypothetical protein